MNPELPPTLISFDLDGTLVDTAGEIAEAANRAIADFGLPPRPEAELTLLIGHGAQALMAQLLAGLAPQVDAAAALGRFEHHYRDTNGTRGLPYPGCAETLQRLRAAGLRLACVTNKRSRAAEQLLRQHGLHEAFELLVGGDTLPQKKPHASVLRHVAAVLGTPPERLAHVGDSAVDVMAARNAGSAAWAVPWGYNGGLLIASAAPDLVFESLPAIADHLLGPAR